MLKPPAADCSEALPAEHSPERLTVQSLSVLLSVSTAIAWQSVHLESGQQGQQCWQGGQSHRQRCRHITPTACTNDRTQMQRSAKALRSVPWVPHLSFRRRSANGSQTWLSSMSVGTSEMPSTAQDGHTSEWYDQTLDSCPAEDATCGMAQHGISLLSKERQDLKLQQAMHAQAAVPTCREAERIQLWRCQLDWQVHHHHSQACHDCQGSCLALQLGHEAPSHQLPQRVVGGKRVPQPGQGRCRAACYAFGHSAGHTMLPGERQRTQFKPGFSTKGETQP